MVKKDFKVGDADSFYKRKKKNLKNFTKNTKLKIYNRLELSVIL